MLVPSKGIFLKRVGTTTYSDPVQVANLGEAWWVVLCNSGHLSVFDVIDGF